MNKNQAEGKLKDIAGRIERQAGEWTGDAKLQARGAAKQVEGKLQNAVGKAQDAVDKAKDDGKALVEGRNGHVKARKDQEDAKNEDVRFARSARRG